MRCQPTAKKEKAYWVIEFGDSNAITRNSGNFAHFGGQPATRLGAPRRLVVTRMETGEFVEYHPHRLWVQQLEERRDFVLISRFLWYLYQQTV